MNEKDMYVEFQNDFTDVNQDGVTYTCIDGWKSSDENEEGKVMARIYITGHGDIVTDIVADPMEYEKGAMNWFIKDAAKNLKENFEFHGGRFYADLKFDYPCLSSESFFTCDMDTEKCSDTMVYLLENNIPEMNVSVCLYLADNNVIKCHCEMGARHGDDLSSDYNHDYVIEGLSAKALNLEEKDLAKMLHGVAAVFCKETCEDGYNYMHTLCIHPDSKELCEKEDLPKSEKTKSNDYKEKENKNFAIKMDNGLIVPTPVELKKLENSCDFYMFDIKGNQIDEHNYLHFNAETYSGGLVVIKDTPYEEVESSLLELPEIKNITAKWDKEAGSPMICGLVKKSADYIISHENFKYHEWEFVIGMSTEENAKINDFVHVKERNQDLVKE